MTSNTGTFSGNVTIAGTLTSGAFTPSSLAVTGDATVGGTLGVTGATTLSTLGVAGATTLTGVSAGTVTNATLNGAVSGNSVTLLNYQKSSGALVGNSSDQVIFTYSLPGNTMQNGKGIRITVVSTHSAGSASVTYKLNVGGASQSYASNTGTTAQYEQALFINDPGSQTSNALFGIVGLNAGTSAQFQTTAINTASPVTITVTFNVANTDQVTPQAFVVELVQ